MDAPAHCHSDNLCCVAGLHDCTIDKGIENFTSRRVEVYGVVDRLQLRSDERDLSGRKERVKCPFDIGRFGIGWNYGDVR